MGNPAAFAIFHRLSSCIKKGNYVEIFFLVSNIVEMLLLAPKEETLGNMLLPVSRMEMLRLGTKGEMLMICCLLDENGEWSSLHSEGKCC